MLYFNTNVGATLIKRFAVCHWSACHPLVRFVPAHGSRQTGASPLPVASVTSHACCRSCPSTGDGGAVPLFLVRWFPLIHR